MILGQKQYSRSPVSQAYIWIADYYDGTYLSEYDLQTQHPHRFYDINKEKLVLFGLMGQGSQVYYNVANGVFHINADRYSISYECEEQEYPLTGRTFVYNDIIQFKNGSSEANMAGFSGQGNSGAFRNTIECFNFGYKKTMNLNDAQINFQCVCSLPLKESVFFQIKISSNLDLPGQLVIRKNGFVIDRIIAPLKANHAGIINWDIH
ncbi:hypothetical protein [Paenibacillus sp. W2I17]|uniref:hypothetical protein n=1 Tax=Paenibacillus sp. W2I17 TaxID=3042311 RepID=UPI00278686D3|nr:hypothetical protein [Paenibacillus sp. W2I17]MDQ0657520.1 hypothetical protein [Paenibacillus sp. W2I17]